MLCTTTVSPSRANRSSSVRSGLVVSLPEVLSVNTVQDLAFKLAFLVLVEGAHAHIPDSLSATDASKPVDLSA